jgi:hypothetical protein
MNLKILLTLALCSSYYFSFTQQEVEPEAIYINKKTSITISISGNDLEIEEHHVSEKKFLRNFEKHTREAVYYSDFDPVSSLQATTLIPYGNGFKKGSTATIETQDIFQPGIFYGGYKRKTFTFPSVTHGSLGKLEYTKFIREAHLIKPFYFDDDIPAEISQFEVVVPSTLYLHHKLFGENIDKIEYTEKKSGSKVIYTWTYKNVPAFKDEIQAPSRAYASPHIILYIDSYDTKNGRKKVNSNLSDLYAWYDDLIQRIPPGNEENLATLVADLTYGLNSDTEKMKAIFQWVQQNIRYIAFEDGMAGFIPRSSSDVYVKRYGDCKDMANLLKDMLSLAGIEAHHAWIGTRSKPYSYEDVPTAIADNHMICSVKTAEGYLFLDATNPFLSFGNPSSMIQGKQALIGLGRHEYEVVKIPVVDRKQNQRNDSVYITMEKDGLRGSFSSHLTGFRKDDIEIKHLKAQIDNDREFIRDFFSVGSNNIVTEKLNLKGLGDQNLAAAVSFNFFQPGYVRSMADKVYINLQMNKKLPGEKIDLFKRTQLLEEDYHYEDRVTTTFIIPEGYSVTFLPSNINKTWPAFGSSVNYKVDGNKVLMEKIIYSEFLYLDKTKFAEWNEFIDAVNSIHLQSLTLTKKK